MLFQLLNRDCMTSNCEDSDKMFPSAPSRQSPLFAYVNILDDT